MKLTPAAEKKVAELIKESIPAFPDHTLFLRVAVAPGGCSGLRYQTFFDYEVKDGDTVTSFDGFDLRVDRMSSPYLEAATMDFVDTIERQGFTVDNPAANGSCSCGDSFH